MKKVFEILGVVLSYGLTFTAGGALVAYEYLKWHPDKWPTDFINTILNVEED